MDKELVFTQTKETTMTPDKTVTVITERLETVDIFGKRTLCGYSHSKSVDFHNNDSSQGLPKNERCTRNFLGKRSGDGISGCICRFCKCGANGVCRDEGRAA